MAKAKKEIAKTEGDDTEEKAARVPFDPDKDIELGREDLGSDHFAMVKRYDGLIDSKGKPKTGVPKLVVVKSGKKGKEYTPNRVTGDVARALAKAIVKFDKAGLFE